MVNKSENSKIKLRALSPQKKWKDQNYFESKIQMKLDEPNFKKNVVTENVIHKFLLFHWSNYLLLFISFQYLSFIFSFQSIIVFFVIQTSVHKNLVPKNFELNGLNWIYKWR